MAEATPHITSVEAPATRPTAPVSGALVAPAMSTLHSQVDLTKPQATALAKRLQSMPPVTLLSHLEAAERLADALDAFKSREQQPLVLTDAQHVHLLRRIMSAPGKALEGLQRDLERALAILGPDRTHVFEVFSMLCAASAPCRETLCDLLQAGLLEGLPAKDGPALLRPLGYTDSEALKELLFIAQELVTPPTTRQVAHLAQGAAAERLRNVASLVDLGLFDVTIPAVQAALVEAAFEMSNDDLGAVMAWAEALTSVRAKQAIALLPRETRTQQLAGLAEACEHGLLAGVDSAREEEADLIGAWLALGPQTATELLERSRALEYAPHLADVVLTIDPAASLLVYAEIAAQIARADELDTAYERFIAGADLPKGGTRLLADLQRYLNDSRNFTPEMLSRLKQPRDDGRPLSGHLNDILTYFR
ncbi:MAG TPA: hypothetical protein VFH51_02610, partial [Myxococcota bacterium]|nr:hypothetical protein [Myxococcota bacterium]